MFKSSILCSKKLIRLEKVFLSSCTNTAKGKWDLYAAVCLERKPVITPELSDLQKEYKALIADIEFERSLKSEHELRHEADLKMIATLKKGTSIDDTEVNLKQTAQDLVDSWTEELSQFKPADRITGN
ncbi:unnamed protein product [Callosobruchus maculatus]|uniref:Large ribosomal subunit protein mL46 N-terminal domain-containing protein n=2 Tax=Callosobruchus maculatus TaxID=64391 RepID=A0A653CUY2_CALMS|nr:unnamed protein product [Callosobruchus maculatus]